MQGQAIDHGSQHAHVVSFHAIKSGFHPGDASEDVSATNDDGHLAPRFRHGDHFIDVILKPQRVNAMTLIGHQGLSTQF
jgi:hypothetical protein